MNAVNTLSAANVARLRPALHPVTAPVARRSSLRGTLAHRWDMIGVLALMGSSAAYAVYTLLHLA